MALRRAPRSLADADLSTRPKRRTKVSARAVAVVAAVAVLAAGAGGYWATRGQAGSADDSILAAAPVLRADGKPVTAGQPVVVIPGEGDAAPAAPPQMAQVRVDVLIDGWSARTLEKLNLRWAVEGDTRYTPLTLAPVSDADVAELLRTTPDTLTQTLARQVTGDSTLKCDHDGCRTSSRAVDLAVLTDPAAVPGLGESYRAWGVNSLLYVASLPLPADADAVTLAADGFDHLTLQALPTGTKDEPPTAANGYLRNRYLVGAGLGRFFSVDAAWTDGQQTPQRWRPYAARGLEPAAADAVVTAKPEVAALGGLAAAWAPASGLTDSHLTYATSPVTGCGTAVLCVPDQVTATVVTRHKSATKACSPDLPGVTNVAVLDDVRVKVQLPYPVHQFGVYDGHTASDLPGGSGYGILGGASPVLASGDVELRWVAAGLFDAPAASLRTTAGRTDTPQTGGMDDQVTLADVLASVRFDGVTWSSC